MVAYFPVSPIFPIQKEVVQKAFNLTFSIHYKTSVLSSAITEEIEGQKLYQPKAYFATLQNWTNVITDTIKGRLKKISKLFKEDGSMKHNEPLFFTNEFLSDTRTLCMVPFPYFLSHKPPVQPSVLSLFQPRDSPFTKIASSKTFNNIFVESNVNIEVLTLYKWRTYIGKRFILILFVHAVYYISFSVGVSFGQEVFGYQLGQTMSHRGHYATITIMFLSWFILFVQEIRQFMYNIPAYMNFYNLIDWTALVMPIASFGLLLTNGKYIVSYH
jgi:hypothetical protein